MGRRRKDFIGPIPQKVAKKETPLESIEFPIQKQFLNAIKTNASIEGTFDMVAVMAELFGVSNDSAYRRIRGVSALSLDEAVLLSKHYEVPLTSLLPTQEENTVFNYKVLNSMATFKKYLEGLLKILDKVSKEDGQLMYAADDVPLFYHFKHKEHAAFKMFAWLRTVLQLPEFDDVSFDISLIPADLLELGEELHNTYTKVNSTEIWTPRSADATLTQINRYWQMGLLKDKQQTARIVSEFADVLLDIQKMTYRGQKGTGATYKLYQSNDPVGTNYVFAKAKEQQYCYIRVQSFNTIVTQGEVFCKDAEEFLRSHLDTSMFITGSNEGARLTFFNNLLMKLENTITNIREDDRWGKQIAHREPFFVETYTE